MSFAEIGGEVLPTLPPKEFFRPAQIDYGNFNNVVNRRLAPAVPAATRMSSISALPPNRNKEV
jgi:hypothetical protein